MIGHKILRMSLVVLLFAMASVNGNPAFSNCNGRKSSPFSDAGKSVFPFIALGFSLLKQDYKGAAISQALIHGAYALNNPIEKKLDKKRPCGCSGSFPSGHMVAMSASAAYMHGRYGLEYGLPLYMGSFILSIDRVRGKAHTWGDMAGTFAITSVIIYTLTPAYFEESGIIPQVSANREQYMLKLTMPTR